MNTDMSITFNSVDEWIEHQVKLGNLIQIGKRVWITKDMALKRALTEQREEVA